MDCIHVKVRDSGAVRVKALYLVIGVNLEGIKEVLGLWMAQTEGAKSWLGIPGDRDQSFRRIVTDDSGLS